MHLIKAPKRVCGSDDQQNIAILSVVIS